MAAQTRLRVVHHVLAFRHEVFCHERWQLQAPARELEGLLRLPAAHRKRGSALRVRRSSRAPVRRDIFA